MIELDKEVAIVKPIQSTKKGKEEESPLIATFSLEFKDLAAGVILPYFHPTLSHFLYTDEGAVRFGSALDSIKWEETHSNAEIETIGHTFQAFKLTNYVITPWFKPCDDKEACRRVNLIVKAHIEIGKALIQGFNLLCECINSEVEVSIRPTQLSLLDKQHEEKPEAAPKLKKGKKPSLQAVE